MAITLTNRQLDLIDRGIINLDDDINGVTANYVRQAISQLIAVGSPPIDILISSYGGLVNPGLYIFDLLNFYPGFKRGHILGYCESIAMVILQACDIRSSSPHANLMIHNPHASKVSYDDFNNESELQKIKEGNFLCREIIKKILLHRTGLTSKKLDTILKKGKNLNPEQALKLNLIDEISCKPLSPEKQQ